MLFLLGGANKKTKKPDEIQAKKHERVRELFAHGKFPVVTTDFMEGKNISKVLGLVCCRGYDSEEAFFGMASMAVNKGAHAIVGYSENVAFHPDGSKYFSCFGTAVMFEWEQDEKYGAAALRDSSLQMQPISSENYGDRTLRRQRVSASGETEERSLPPRMSEAASVADLARIARAARSGDSSEVSPRLNSRIDDDIDLPPLRPVSEAMWQNRA